MNTQKRQQSSQAQVAKLCRQHCKTLGIKCTAKSDSFSMGDSVHVTIFDQSPDIMGVLETEFNQYQYGHFDGMNDIYEYSNSRKDIPQTKYMSISNDFSPELVQEAYTFIISKYPVNCADFPVTYLDGQHLQLHDNCPAYMDMSQDVYQLLRGSSTGMDQDNSLEFWETRKPKAKVIELRPSTTDLNIEIREGTKAGYSEILFSDKPDKEIRSQLKAAGFRWSRHNSCWWGKTENLPFNNDDQPTPPTSGKPKKNGDKFRTMADKLQPQIDNKLADRQTNTAKRIAQAAHSRLEGEKLKRTQTCLYAIADMIEADTLLDSLSLINSKKDIYELMGEKTTPVTNGYHSYYVGTGEPHHVTPIACALWGLLTPKTEEELKAEELAEKIKGLQFAQIPGYFPTPAKVIDMMLDYADLQATDRVLEPNLGSCAIADHIAPMVAEVKGFEINYTLADIAESKDYLIDQKDFLTVQWADITQYEKVMMNPPFENLQDCEHVRHAFQFLKSGGRLVSIMSPSFEHNSNKKAQAFREWLNNQDHMVIDIEAGAFKESGTMIASKLVIIDKD